MHAHPYLAARLAETRAADLRAAARARLHRSKRSARVDAPPAPDSSPATLNSYPRLCGLPVTIERLPIQARQSKGVAVAEGTGDAVEPHRTLPQRQAKKSCRAIWDIVCPRQDNTVTIVAHAPGTAAGR
jgi:hypothetical protein